MPDELMTPYDVQEAMLARSGDIDEAIRQHRDRHRELAEKKHLARVAYNTALLTASGSTAAERKARAEQGCEELIYQKEMAEALADSSLEALRARRDQLNALNGLAYTVREEMKLAR
jgi:hypothetical protein